MVNRLQNFLNKVESLFVYRLDDIAFLDEMILCFIHIYKVN